MKNSAGPLLLFHFLVPYYTVEMAHGVSLRIVRALDFDELLSQSTSVSHLVSCASHWVDIAGGFPASERRKTFQLCAQQDVVKESALAAAVQQLLLRSGWLQCERQLATVLCRCVYFQCKMALSRAAVSLPCSVDPCTLLRLRGTRSRWVHLGDCAARNLQRVSAASRLASVQTCSSVCTRL